MTVVILSEVKDLLSFTRSWPRMIHSRSFGRSFGPRMTTHG